MPNEVPSSSESEIYDIETLSPQSKVRHILEIFDLGEDKEANEIRKNKFLKLIERYWEQKARSKVMDLNQISDSESDRAKTHNQIMEIIRSMSISTGLNPSQRKLTEYLSADRKRVTIMVDGYFSNYNSANSNQQSPIAMARRGEGPFQFSGSKDDDR